MSMVVPNIKVDYNITNNFLKLLAKWDKRISVHDDKIGGMQLRSYVLRVKHATKK